MPRPARARVPPPNCADRTVAVAYLPVNLLAAGSGRGIQCRPMTDAGGLNIRVIFLGTGTSNGVPMIGCDCPVCTSDDPRDRRTRPSVAVCWAGRTVLVDTTPELRLQCLANNIRRVDAVLITHHHADHVAGLDDLRAFNWIMRSPINVYGREATVNRLGQMFPYAFREDPDYPSQKPSLRLVTIDEQPFELFGLTVTPVPLWHGPMPVLGYRFGRFAYCTDCNHIPDSSLPQLEGLEVLVLEAVRLRPHSTHFNLAQAIEAARRIAARKTLFTHISHRIRHAQTSAELPDGMELAYDGLSFEVGGATFAG